MKRVIWIKERKDNNFRKVTLDVNSKNNLEQIIQQLKLEGTEVKLNQPNNRFVLCREDEEAFQQDWQYQKYFNNLKPVKAIITYKELEDEKFSIDSFLPNYNVCLTDGRLFMVHFCNKEDAKWDVDFKEWLIPHKVYKWLFCSNSFKTLITELKNNWCQHHFIISVIDYGIWDKRVKISDKDPFEKYGF